MTTNLLISIHGREALPVRAISFATGWLVSPDTVANDLGESDERHPRLARGLRAYHYAAGACSVMYPKEWDNFIAAIKRLHDELKSTYEDDDSGYAAWRELSPFALPAGVFVWRDEFEASFQKAQKGITYIEEREGQRELTYLSALPQKLHKQIFEGFPTNASMGFPMGPKEHRAHVRNVLTECGGNKTAASKRLGISRQRVSQLVEGAPPVSSKKGRCQVFYAAHAKLETVYETAG